MLREVDLADISDGKLYTSNDLVKADCQSCVGCSDCCRGMGDSIVLDPYDVYRLTNGLETSFAMLMTSGKVELGVVDGILLPHFSMDPKTDACVFLSDLGRCTIHEHRSGFCRLFPLGRIYDDEGDFKYFLQIHECSHKQRSKIKVSKWMDTTDFKRYEAFIKEWHGITRALATKLDESGDYELRKKLTMDLVKIFYISPYKAGDFYEQFRERVEAFKSL